MIIDYTKIYVKSGDGGHGHRSFRREKYVAAGGPDGGDGGKGGNVYFKVDKNLNTLLNFSYAKKFIAGNGSNGDAKNCTGKSAEDLYIYVPKGTIIKDIDKNSVIADLSDDDDEILIAKGGRGGRGNQHFATSTRQVPNFSEAGEKGIEKNIELELKMIADVGLVGFPNVGKSTIISTVSSAKPKIANYHFTTLEPALGVVKAKDNNSYVIADIPGIIEGASEGVGLGLKFLKHIERTRILLHVIDISGSEGRNPVEDYILINNELSKYSEKLKNKKQIVALNKIDSLNDDTNVKEVEKLCKKDNIKAFKISAVTKQGLEELFDYVYEVLKTTEKEEVVHVDENYSEEIIDNDWNIEKIDNEYFVTGKPIERMMQKVNIYDSESRSYMQRMLKKFGVMDELRKMGLKSGEVIDIIEYKMEYYE